MRPRVSLQRVAEMLALLDQMPNPPALMVYGPPGIGKTTVLKRFAEDRGYDLRVKHLSRMDTTDWSGIPRTGDGVEYTEFLPINLFQKTTKKKIVIFFDELNTALPQVLNAALDVILEKKGDGARATLPPETIIVAAGNLGEEDGTYVEELSSAVKTRMIQVEFDTSDARDQWLRWAKAAGVATEVVDHIEGHRDLDVLLDLADYLKTLDARPREDGQRPWRDDPAAWGLFADLVMGTIGRDRGAAFLSWLQERRADAPDPQAWRERVAGCRFLTDATSVLGDIAALVEAFACAEAGLQHAHDGAVDFADRVLRTVQARRQQHQFTANERAAVPLGRFPLVHRRLRAAHAALAAWFAGTDE